MLLASSVLVGMSEIQILKERGQLVCLGLGSCIGLCALDPVANIAGMVHVMLPESFGTQSDAKAGKFADTGVPSLIAQMETAGAKRARLILAMAGGAQVFKFGSGVESRLDVGARNSLAVESRLRALGLTAKAKDVGGDCGRTVTFTLESGLVTVKTVPTGEKPFCNLRA